MRDNHKNVAAAVAAKHTMAVTAIVLCSVGDQRMSIILRTLAMSKGQVSREKHDFVY